MQSEGGNAKCRQVQPRHRACHSVSPDNVHSILLLITIIIIIIILLVYFFYLFPIFMAPFYALTTH